MCTWCSLRWICLGTLSGASRDVRYVASSGAVANKRGCWELYRRDISSREIATKSSECPRSGVERTASTSGLGRAAEESGTEDKGQWQRNEEHCTRRCGVCGHVVHELGGEARCCWRELQWKMGGDTCEGIGRETLPGKQAITPTSRH